MSDQVVSIRDVLEQQEQLEQHALKKFPYNPDACTLYMDIAPRQLLFACLTCSPTNAICYSCGLRCHADHEIVELYTKRGFRCDCGTSRFPNSKCELRTPMDDDWANDGMNYCHNFQGTFCVCNESVHDESYGQSAMFQCLVGSMCGEDWFHARCILGITREEEVQRQSKMDYDDEESGDDLDTVYSELPVDFGGIICPQCINTVRLLKKSDAVLTEVNGYVFLKPNYGDVISSSPTLSKLLAEFPFLDGKEESYTPELDEQPASLLEAGNQALEQLPRDAVLQGLAKFNVMQTDLVQYIKEISKTGRAVTKADIEEFFNKVSENR